ncbi:hypothetical protein BGX26_009736 [Mortierella sp. AD094]|nr:hypothetical protein BGX26_009736 [Mortierella sp. AD094]
MSFTHSPQQKQTEHSQTYQYSSQHSQYPYNPYPDQRRYPCSQSQGPLYTLRDHTSTPAPTLESYPSKKYTSNESLSPPQDMFVTLEKLLMGMSPFPPTIPNLAKPTCPPLRDQTMAELSSPSSSPSSVSASEPAEPYTLDQFYLKQEQPSEKQQLELLKNHYQHQHGSDCSTRSVSPAISPYSYDSSSPALAMESGRSLPYWSPSTPSLQMDHDWSNPSSPLLSSQQQQSGQSSHWEYPLFDQMSLPLSISDLGDCVSPSNSQDNNQSQQQQQQYQSSQSQSHSSNTTLSPNIIRRAARTPPRQRISSELSGIRAYQSSELSGIRAYQSSAHHYTHHHYYHHNNNQSAASSSSTTSTSVANTGVTNTNSTSSSSTNSTDASIRGGVKSYPCPTCTKPFPTRTQLKSHMAIHVDNFPFPCLYSGCDLHFKRKHDLRRHVDAKHALVKKYLCASGCGEGFGRRDQMVRHLRKGNCARSFQRE